MARPVTREFPRAWLGLLPFFAFAIAFLLLPSVSIVVGAFSDTEGHLTFANILGIFRRDFLNAFQSSISISLITALAGGLFGFLLAYAAILGGLPRPVRSILLTFSGVASNFAGVPLAFAFISTIGPIGLVTQLINSAFSLNIYQGGFTYISFWGVSLTYMYFQFPLMVLIIAPALDGLKREWRESAENLGASAWQYWRYVALPVLTPSLLGTMILLFGNSFGAYATAYSLTGGLINLVPIVIGEQISGNVLYDPGLGNALALGMIVILTISIIGYTWLQSKTARWLR